MTADIKSVHSKHFVADDKLHHSDSGRPKLTRHKAS